MRLRKISALLCNERPRFCRSNFLCLVNSWLAIAIFLRTSRWRSPLWWSTPPRWTYCPTIGTLCVPILSQNFKKACSKRTIELFLEGSTAISSGRQDDVGSHAMSLAQIQKKSRGCGSSTSKGRGTICTNADTQIIAPAGPNKAKRSGS